MRREADLCEEAFDLAETFFDFGAVEGGEVVEGYREEGLHVVFGVFSFLVDFGAKRGWVSIVGKSRTRQTLAMMRKPRIEGKSWLINYRRKEHRQL